MTCFVSNVFLITKSLYKIELSIANFKRNYLAFHTDGFSSCWFQVLKKFHESFEPLSRSIGWMLLWEDLLVVLCWDTFKVLLLSFSRCQYRN